MSYESQGPEVYQYSSQPYAFSPPTQNMQNNQLLSKQPNIVQFQVSPPAQIINNSPRDFLPNNNLYRPINYPVSNLPSYQPNPLPLQPTIINSNPQPHIEIDKRLLGSAQNKQIPNQANQDRFQHYNQDSRQYKYNIFSIADEPWNRCMNGQGCGNLPSNECIARSNYKRYWY